MEMYVVQHGTALACGSIIKWEICKNKKGYLAAFEHYEEAENAMKGVMQQYDQVRILCLRIKNMEGYVARLFERRKNNGNI